MRSSVATLLSSDGSEPMGKPHRHDHLLHAHVSVCFPNDKEISPEAVAGKWKEITTFGTPSYAA